MKSCHQGCFASIFLTLFVCQLFAQDQRSFNQNSSRSNNALSISFTPLYTNATGNSNDSLLFHGNGAGFRFSADYFFGIAGISFTSGFVSSSPDDAAINNFLSKTSAPQDQLLITKGKQQNIYMLLGPSLSVGKNVGLYVHAKGGLFINNSGLVNIQQKGAQRAMYRNEATEKSVYPGFLTGAGIQYKTKSGEWSFGIGADYMNTRSEVNNYDARRGGAIEPLKLSRGISDIATGITVRYNILSPRDHATGQASGKRQLGKPKYDDMTLTAREAGSGMATGKTYQPGRPVYGNITAQEPTGDNCGPVTQRTTNPDGSSEEMTFACPADAANYNNRISMNVTVPKQTQGSTFGEKVNAGLHAAGGALSQGVSKQGIIHRDLAARNIISGKLSWASAGEGMGIVTNAIIGNTPPRSGSTTMNSQTSSTRQTQQTSFGTMVRLSAREAGSGMATGKRSSREAGSGMATGRRQYEPIFAEGEGNVCNPCLASAKMSDVKNNPLYTDKGISGENPLYDPKNRMAGGEDEDCDGIAGIAVSLIEPGSGTVIAKTITETSGDFFFANVPDGNYLVKVAGSFLSKKGYDYYGSSKTDLLGKVEQSGEPIQLLINGDQENDMQQKAGISTSRSNIRSKSITIVEADLDGDGDFESLRATATFSDGSSKDITSAAKKRSVSNAPGTKGIMLDESALQMRRRVEVLKSNKQGDPAANRLTSVEISSSGGRFRATGTFSDGSTRDVTQDIEVNSSHAGVRQYSLAVADLDGDGAAEAVVKTKTKSNQSNDRVATGDVTGDGMIWSPRSNIKMINVAAGDVDGDGVTDMAAGNMPTEFAVLRDPLKGHFENGDIPTQQRPGSPIGGLSIKGGKNPGGNLRTIQTNDEGEFEFTDLEPGDYTFVVEQRVFINDETLVSTGTRAQDHNSSRSNKSASYIASDTDDDDGSDRKGDVKVTASQNSQSLKTASYNTMPVKWTAPESLRRTINTTRANIKSMLEILDDLDEQLDGDSPANRSIVNTSRSNIKSQRLSMYDMRETLADIEYIDKETAMNELNKKMTEINIQFGELQELLKEMGAKYNSISNVLKTKHDTVKNSVGNIR